MSNGENRLTAIDLIGRTRFDLRLPGRCHGIIQRPGSREVVAFARRPGQFAIVVDPRQSFRSHRISTPPDRHVYGHGAFSQDGRWLYATENDFAAERGVIGIYDAAAFYRRAGEIPSHDIGPHELAMMPDGQSLVVANGGIATHPRTGRRKLNLPFMQSSVTFVDTGTGALIRRERLAPEYSQVSLRHLGVSPHGDVVVVAQYQGPASDHVPLIAIIPSRAVSVPTKTACHEIGMGTRCDSVFPHIGVFGVAEKRAYDREKCCDRSLRPWAASAALSKTWNHYCGSVALTPDGRYCAVSAPRGNRISVWNIAQETQVASTVLPDGCGLTWFSPENAFIATGGLGDMITINQADWRGVSRAIPNLGSWDNHLSQIDLC